MLHSKPQERSREGIEVSQMPTMEGRRSERISGCRSRYLFWREDEADAKTLERGWRTVQPEPIQGPGST